MSDSLAKVIARICGPVRAHYYDITERLRLDAVGPRIHEEYYRMDAGEARAEILALRSTVAALRAEIAELRRVSRREGRE